MRVLLCAQAVNVSFLLLFGNFFIQRWVFGAKKGSKGKKDGAPRSEKAE